MPYIHMNRERECQAFFFIRQLHLAEGMRLSGGQKRVHGQFESFEDVAGIEEEWSA